MTAKTKAPPEGQGARAEDKYVAFEAIGIVPQGQRTLEEYSQDCLGAADRATRLYEVRAAKACVCGMRDERLQRELWERISEQGNWTLQRVREEMQCMVECEKRRKGKKTSLAL